MGRQVGSRLSSDGFLDGAVNSVATIPTSSSVSSFASSFSDSPPKVNYIEHSVSKLDTLAGVAIMYGVEVADIKRLNGLMTDREIFAYKSLRIPLTGRHPPPCLSNVSVANRIMSRTQTPPRRPSNDVLDLFNSLELKTPSKVSPAMSSLQAYYSLTPPKKGPVEGTGIPLYGTGCCSFVDELLSREPPLSDPLPGRHKKTRSLINELSHENGEISEEKAFTETMGINEMEKSIRRRQKNDSSPSLTTRELLEDYGSGFSNRKGKVMATCPTLYDPLPSRHKKTRSLDNNFSFENGKITEEKAITAENNEFEKSIRRRQKNDASPSLSTLEWLEDNDSAFSRRKAKGLAIGPKLGNPTDLDMGHFNAAPNGDSSMVNGFVSVRKSSSTSSLQEPENNSSIWPTSKWTWKAEALARPLFDGLPKPISPWKSKAALD
ncbi:hypothetical protein Cni_G19495 [Canna indica]|uniref:LysM domain-containing protein n=1 Tax=Canna indica TaxID=4628 RepID=A0AAQ3KRI3_9LILI|nr:hypothetical protein Cni_G19495 [Canna indica]